MRRITKIILFFFIFEACLASGNELQIALEAITEGNYELAIPLLEKLSQQGNSTASNKLGELYFFGEGIKSNPKKAYEYFTQAASNDSPEGQYNLGVSYQTGIGAPMDIQKAIFWYEKSAAQNNVSAYLALGNIFANKTSFKDLCEGKYWYQQAVLKDSLEAKVLLEQLESRVRNLDCKDNR